VNHYPRHVGDITKATFGLSLTEFGAYDRLLDAYYDNEAPLPLDPKERYRMAGALTKSDRAAVDYVVKRYFVEMADGWHQKRADEEIETYRERCSDAVRAINYRWSRVRESNDERSTDVIRPYNEPNTNQNQNQNQNHINQEPKPRRERAAPPALPDWIPPDAWEEWRKHRGKKLTPQAVTRQINKLSKLKALGHDPKTMIDLAIESGWSTFYPHPKINGDHRSVHDIRADTADQMFRRGKYAPSPDNDERDITGTSERLD